MKKLAADSGAAKLRFFGKIRGTDNDYYVAEGEGAGGEEGGEGEGEVAPDVEPNGTGEQIHLLRFTFFPWSLG